MLRRNDFVLLQLITDACVKAAVLEILAVLELQFEADVLQLLKKLKLYTTLGGSRNST